MLAEIDLNPLSYATLSLVVEVESKCGFLNVFLLHFALNKEPNE